MFKHSKYEGFCPNANHTHCENMRRANQKIMQQIPQHSWQHIYRSGGGRSQVNFHNFKFSLWMFPIDFDFVSCFPLSRSFPGCFLTPTLYCHQIILYICHHFPVCGRLHVVWWATQSKQKLVGAVAFQQPAWPLVHPSSRRTAWGTLMRLVFFFSRVHLRHLPKI